MRMPQRRGLGQCLVGFFINADHYNIVRQRLGHKSPQQSNAQTLWLGSRIEYKLGNQTLAYGLGEQLRKRYPQSPEALAFEQGRFNE